LTESSTVLTESNSWSDEKQQLVFTVHHHTQSLRGAAVDFHCGRCAKRQEGTPAKNAGGLKCNKHREGKPYPDPPQFPEKKVRKFTAKGDGTERLKFSGDGDKEQEQVQRQRPGRGRCQRSCTWEGVR
jgi:hypothetical protein